MHAPPYIRTVLGEIGGLCVHVWSVLLFHDLDQYGLDGKAR